MPDQPYERIHWHLSEAIIALCEYTDGYPDPRLLVEIARLLTEVQQRVLELENGAIIGGGERAFGTQWTGIA